ncbi:hypothetical protein [Alkalihalobacillus sp. AL-G]|uniref:hypothetical protein n=1 Tax=Alkalihalobacillus sp. AL-G TaxID=2926399 RepID=UPI00272B7CD3|nr:hypothetical protein [Alkalihalobacillus sp. AL-G]WLD94761.1 hypothetical protein MOJ78_07725 [Alkalihalobacillus sp. AL-G]
MALLELLWVLFELFVEVIIWFAPEKSKLERNIERFKYLKKRRNVKRLLRDPYERNYFIQRFETTHRQSM